MLEALHIQNYALIDEIEIDFAGGFNVLTGETGAGKSIIIGALNLVLGGRASNELLRDPAKPARIDAVFRMAKPPKRLSALLKEHDIPLSDNELILSRTLTAEGRSRGYVCGNVAPISLLAEIGDELVDLHGQHEHQSLLKPERQLDLLDGYAGADGLSGEVGERVATLRELAKTIAELESDDRERTRRMEFLRHEIAEIDAADLRAGEEEELKARRNLIANAERIFSLASHARTELYEAEEGSAILAIDAASADVGELARIDERFQPLLAQLSGVRAEVEEVADELRTYADRIEFDPNELDNLNARLAVISDLKRKYGRSIEEILEYRDRSRAEVSAYDSRDQRLADLQTGHRQLLSETQKMAADLANRRKVAARRLDRLISAALQDLGMRGGRFETAFETVDLSSSGINRIEFMLSANPGEKLKPLRQVASGGEISRIMLALKAVFAGADKIPTLVFDEIDAGVGGHVARNVARKLHELAASHQTICITHIAQIAASAQRHYRVAKTEQKGRNITEVIEIGNQARIEEIARLLDGSVSDVSAKHARALLKEMEGVDVGAAQRER
jgi:DNA repair protein RecN (Recombination protein N)